MGVFAWILSRARWSTRRSAKVNRWDRVSLAPNLRVRRLEERRVLNADAAPVQALVVNAGTAAGDGHADTFVVEQHDNQVHVSVNGKEVSNTPISQLSSIKIQGSSDDDILIAEFKSGEPMAGLNLMFDGKGGNDSLVLSSNAPVNSVAYTFGASGSDHIDIRSGSATTQIGFAGVESVNDSLTAQSRSFNVQSGGQQVTVSDAGTANDDRSEIDLTNSVDGSRQSIVFKNPTNEFSLKTDASTDKPDTVTLNGLDHNYHANMQVVGSSDDLLVVHGSTDIGIGNVEWSTGRVRIENSLTTSHANVDIHAVNEFLITSAGTLHNDAGNIRVDAPTIEQDGTIVAHGGLVHLDSGDGGTTIVRGTIDVSQPDPTKSAGTVHVLGSQVGLFDNAQIDATATVGAGTILIGGDYQGKNPSIRNALRTYVGPNAVIRADATEQGNGGKVIVWADEATRFYGTITARGGSQGGNGGFAEVSGKQDLVYRGIANLTAIAGSAGNLLLDPDVLIIDTTTDAGLLDVSLADPIVAFGEGGATAHISAAYLIAQLNLNLSNITLQANDEIDVNLPVVAGPASTLGLELDAPLIKFAAGANIVLNHADLTIGNTKAGNVELDGDVLLSTAGGVGLPGDITIKGTVTGAAGTETLQLNSATGSIDVGGAVSSLDTLNVIGANNATFHGAVDVTTLTFGTVTGTASVQGALTADTLTVPAAVNNASFTGNGSTVTNAVAFANTGALTLGQLLGTQTYNGGLSTTSVGGTVTLNGRVQTSNDAITLGAVMLGSNTTLDTNATTTAGDITLGAVAGGTFDLTLETGAAVAGADVTGTTVSGVGTLALQNIGGTASFSGAISATSLSDAATVNNVSLTGTGSAITNLVTFANSGTLTLGQALGTQTFNGGLSTTGVGLAVTLNGLIQSSNDPITFGDVTLGSNVTIDTNATTSAGDITLGAVTGGGFNLTLETGAGVAGADVSGTSVSSVGTLALQNIGGTAAFTGALTVATLTDAATVNNVSLTGTGSVITNLVTFSNAGTLTLGQGLGSQTYNGGFNTTGVGGVVTLNGLLQTSNDPITIGPAMLGSNTTLDTNATTGAGDITLGAITGGGFNLTLETGAGIAGADVTGTSISSVGTLALQNIGGTAAFAGAITAATLTDAATVNNLSLTGTGSTITNLVTFSNNGALTLGQALGTQTYNGGFNTTGVGGLVTLNGVLQTSNDPINLGPVTLGSNTTLDTNATTAAGDITLGAVTGGGFNLTLETGAGVAGADVSGTSVSSVGTLALQNIGGTAAFTGALTVATLTDAATVNNVSLTGTGSVITNLVTFSNAGMLTLGQALGTQTYNGGFNTTAVGGVVTLNGLLQTSNDPITIGAAALGSSTTLDTNATNGVGDITIGAIVAGGFDLTLETGNAVAGADVTGTSVSGAGTLALQNIGGTVSFTGPITATVLSVPATVNNVSLTGTGSTITNLVAFANTGTLVLGQGLGTQTYNGGFDTTAVGGVVTLNGVLQSSNDPITVGPIALGSNTTLDTNATTAAGDLTLGAVAGGTFNLTVETGVGIAGADVNGTTVAGVGTLALQNIGGTASFTGAITATTLTVAATVNNVSLTGNGTTITNLVNFANTGTLALGQNLGTQTYNGGISKTNVGGDITIRGTITTSADPITLTAPTIDLANATIDTNNADIVFVTNKLQQNLSTIDAGNGIFQIRPTTVTTVIEFAATQSIAVPPGAFYDSDFNNITAASFIVGGAAQVGDIHVGNAAAALTFNESVLFQNSSSGQIFLDSDYNSATGNGNLTLTAGSGVTIHDLAVDTTATVNLGNGGFTVNIADTTKTTTLAENTDIKAAGGITFNSNIDANALAIDRTLTLDSAAISPILVTGDIGAVQALAGLTITQSSSATFTKSVNVTAGLAGTINLVDTATTIDFQASTSADILMTAAKAYNVFFGGALNQIGSSTNFLNTGTVQLGNDAGDSTIFAGNLAVTVPGAVRIAGTVAATGVGNTITLGDANTGVTATANAVVGGTATGAISLGDATINDGVTLIVGIGVANAINLSAVQGVAGGAASNFTINTTDNVAAAEAINTDIDTMRILSANNVTFFSTVAVNNLVQNTGTGITDFRDDVAAGTLIDLNTHTLRAHGTVANKIELVSGGTIKMNVAEFAPGSNSPANFDFLNVFVTTAAGRITEATFAFNAGTNRFTALDKSTVTSTPLTPAQNVAKIKVIVADVDGVVPFNPVTDGTNFGVTADWLEGNATSARFDNAIVNGDTNLAVEHTYLANPEPNPADDIPMIVYVTNLAGGTIQPSIGGRQLVGTPDAAGQLPANTIGISTTLVIPVLTPFLPAIVPPSEPPSVIPPAPPIEANVETVANPVEVSPTQIVEASAGYSSAGEERYYVLRIVSFDKDGALVDDREHQIRLDDEKLKAINFNPKLNRIERFDLGKLPVLFGRLPDDRYRIYLIEDRTERLILDFTIQQGQPVETRDVEDTSTEMGKAATDPFRDEPAVPAAPGTNQKNGAVPADSPPAKSGVSNDRLQNIDRKSTAASPQLRSESSKTADTFAERLGRASFVSRGGIVVGAAALAFSRTDRWEQSIDRVMERFDGRRQSPQQRRQRKREQPPIEISSSNSTHNSL